ncbi:helix-turn-helix domain-containing protein [Flaviflexus massiliensis]|uniref:helix-turn-helix domain-containing protein n=1 Tax=Flaviflexus massiliensis TaxID=1522309 RepID=UPI0006D56458|nr:helix-turn-helix domain-containing protein [Flaviflexus massiliensis]
MATKALGVTEKRARLQPPVITLKGLRNILGLSLAEACALIEEKSPEITISRGSLCAIENGSRGASTAMLTALEVAYGLDQGDLVTNYEPRSRRNPNEKTAA